MQIFLHDKTQTEMSNFEEFLVFVQLFYTALNSRKFKLQSINSRKSWSLGSNVYFKNIWSACYFDHWKRFAFCNVKSLNLRHSAFLFQGNALTVYITHFSKQGKAAMHMCHVRMWQTNAASIKRLWSCFSVPVPWIGTRANKVSPCFSTSDSDHRGWSVSNGSEPWTANIEGKVSQRFSSMDRDYTG